MVDFPFIVVSICVSSVCFRSSCSSFCQYNVPMIECMSRSHLLWSKHIHSDRASLCVHHNRNTNYFKRISRMKSAILCFMSNEVFFNFHTTIYKQFFSLFLFKSLTQLVYISCVDINRLLFCISHLDIDSFLNGKWIKKVKTLQNCQFCLI